MLKNLIPEIPISIKSDDTNLSVQQQLVLQQRYYALDQLVKANESLDQKSITLLQASSLIFALIGVLQFPKALYNPSLWIWIAIVVAFILFLSMVVCLIKAWSPTDHTIPGKNDEHKMFNEYIWVSDDESFKQILSDCKEAYDRSKKTNSRKAKYIVWAAWIFVAQVFGLLFIALLSSQLFIVP